MKLKYRRRPYEPWWLIVLMMGGVAGVALWLAWWVQ